MSEVEWTKYQQLAIDAYGKGTAVSAAAGSGKTAVLIERIVRLLCDKEKKIPADTLLAVTFTKDAAAQMRDKLNSAFEKRVADDPDNSWLLQQQNLLQLARVSTINSFCLDLVKDNLHRYEFQGGLKILEDSENELIYKQAYDDTMSEMCENSPDDYRLLYESFCASSDRRSDAVEAVYKFIRSICSREMWFELAQSNFTDEDKFRELMDGQWKKAEKIIEKMSACVKRFEYCLYYKITAGNEYTAIDNISKINENYETLREILHKARKAVEARDEGALHDLDKEKFNNLSLKGEAKKSAEVKVLFEDILAEAKYIRQCYRDGLSELTKLFKLSEKHYRENREKALKIFRVLYKTACRVEELSYEAKLEKNAIDFSDAELMAKDLLVEEKDGHFVRTPLGEEIRSSGMYRIIVIDEFQDVNNLQELIFRAVSDSDNLDIMGKNIFFVGDMKQAIYKFRLTNPKLFQNDLELARDERNSEYLQAINLNMNFRSRKEIIDFCNFTFKNIMSLQCGDVDYNKDERLEYGAKYTDREEPVEIMLVNGSSCKDDSKGYSQENLAVALRIKELLDEGALVCDKGVDRPCRASDFCVLVSTNANVKYMSKALERVGLKAYCEDSKGYIKSREISLALDLLRVIDTPMNDISLAAVMLSPILGFTPDETAVVRSKCRSEKTGFTNHMYQIITAAAKENDKESDKESEFVDMGNEVLQNKCRAAYKLIEGLRYDAMSMSLERLIRKIFDVTDLMAITALYLDSDKKRANLRLLLEYASSYEKNGRDGVTGFLHFIDSVSENDSAFKQATSVTNGGETVKVQTYHKSKGLEYPFVFLCSLDDKLITKQETDTLIRLNNDEGVGIKFFEKRLNVKRKELFSAGLEERSENDLKSERMRILYVGCTRARERLFVVYALNYASNSSIEKCKENMLTLLRTDLGGERISPDAVCGCGTMLEWLTLVLAKHPDRDTLAEWLGADLSRIPTDEAAEDVKLVYNIKDPEEPETAEADDDTDTAEADDRIVDSLLKKYRYEYKNTDSLLPSKLTVTEIVRGEKEKKLGEKNPEFFPNLPRLNEELDKLTAAEKGTFTHKFMELANYDNAEKSVSDELARLVNGGFFTKKEASGVYVKRLEAFFSGEFYLRMKRSPDLRREQKFLVSADDLPDCPELRGVMGSGGMIQGIADCIFKEDDGWVLVDYKTDNFKNEDEMSEYGTQLKLYKAAFELIYGEKVRSCYIYSFKLGVGKEFDL